MNARKELQDFFTNPELELKCALIQFSWQDNEGIVLPLNFTEQDLQKFFQELDVIYDNGYGCQELYGTVWLTNGTWLSRGEYDGREWWQHNELPEIPAECKNVKIF
jgi:hypothetical protein